MSFGAALRLLADDDKFRDELINVLRRGHDWDAFFFETPPVTADAVEETSFEFVLVDAPRLVGRKVDTTAFSGYFNR